MQIVTIHGRLAADAETKSINGNDVTEFRMAVDQGWGDKRVTNWFRVSVWGKKGAGAAPYLLKSGQVTVVGELEIGEYNGKPQYNIRASDFTLPPKASGDRQQSRDDGLSHGNRSGFGSGARGPVDDDLDSDVPFLHCGMDNERRRVI